ncbi:hypothetical protein ACIREO_21765 [Streptomyces sp. NPDC102441]|uniref:hypothetical protein n=1 Tax=Streptomyces sp. NPDC102441 TaxID=3366176 RepID=UPI003818F5DA
MYEEGKDALAPATGRLDPEQREQLAQLLESLLSPPLSTTPRPERPVRGTP